jgi:CheY-like chemotaxis protein/HPt (histidine-containing phosphotransfer) domain-containing protein
MNHVKAMLTVLRENYLRDLPNQIDDIEQVLLDLERGGFQLDLCRELYRQVHTLKGSGGTFGMSFISDVCHPFEDLLTNLIENPGLLQQGLIETALQYVDLMRKACFSYAANLEPGSELRLSLYALRQRMTKNFYAAIIVESSDVLIGAMRETLTEFGFRIEVVEDGYTALGRLLAEPFDVLITSLENPRLNGTALISAIQNSGSKVARTKTILLTTSDHLNLQAHPDYVLKKNAELKKRFRVCIAEILAKTPK